jgi:hypothetical protein
VTSLLPVIDQQYSSATFFPLRANARYNKFGVLSQILLIQFFNFFQIVLSLKYKITIQSVMIIVCA